MTLPPEVQQIIEAYCNENGKIAEVNGYPVFAHFQLFDAAQFGYALANEWVSVEDRLPDVGDGEAIEVSICSHIYDAEEPMVVVSGVFYNGDFYLCAEWHGGDPDLIEPLTPGRITHWKHLPSPPSK